MPRLASLFPCFQGLVSSSFLCPAHFSNIDLSTEAAPGVPPSSTKTKAAPLLVQGKWEEYRKLRMLQWNVFSTKILNDIFYGICQWSFPAVPILSILSLFLYLFIFSLLFLLWDSPYDSEDFIFRFCSLGQTHISAVELHIFIHSVFFNEHMTYCHCNLFFSSQKEKGTNNCRTVGSFIFFNF